MFVPASLRIIRTAVVLALLPAGVAKAVDMYPSVSISSANVAFESRSLSGFFLLSTGDAFVRQGQWDKALRVFEEGLASDPANRAEYLRRMGDYYAHQNDRKKALSFYSDATTGKNPSFEAYEKLVALDPQFQPKTTPLKIFWPRRQHVRGLDVAVNDDSLFTLKGVQLGVLFASAYAADGLQIGALGCGSEAVRGVQISVNNLTKRMAGLQLGVLSNRAKVLMGGQIGLVNNFTPPSGTWMATQDGKTFAMRSWEGVGIRGLQVGFMNNGGRLQGVQIGFANTSRSLAGLRVGGFNYSGYAQGVEIGGVNIRTEGDHVGGTGAMFGLANISDGEFRGLQLGIVNISHGLHGVQIGLMNVVVRESGRPRVVPLVNASF